MKKVVILVCLIALTTFSFARILRVGFVGVPPVANVDYTNFFLAHGAANAGDTIYVWPGRTLDDSWPGIGTSNPVPISKRLFIVSKGNWLDSSATPRGNSFLQAIIGTAYFGRNISFNNGSQGSVITGFNAQGANVIIQVSNITIKRNYNIGISLEDNSVSNLTVEGNYRVFFGGNDNSSYTYTNVTIRDNFIYSLRLPLKGYSGSIYNNTWAYDALNSAGNANGGDPVMSDPVIGSSTNIEILLRNGTWLFENNLMISYTNASPLSNINRFAINGGSQTTFNYNVVLKSSNDSSFWQNTGTGNALLNPSTVSTIFTAFPLIGTKSADGRYILPAGSAAKAASSMRPGSTIDAGMFGGDFPYKLSTIAPIPTIYSISSPDGNVPAGSTIRVDLKTRTNN